MAREMADTALPLTSGRQRRGAGRAGSCGDHLRNVDESDPLEEERPSQRSIASITKVMTATSSSRTARRIAGRPIDRSDVFQLRRLTCTERQGHADDDLLAFVLIAWTTPGAGARAHLAVRFRSGSSEA